MDPLGSKNNIFGVVYKIRQRNKPEAPTLAMKVVPKGQDAKEFTIHKDLYDHEFPGADSKGVNHKFIPKIFGDKLTSSVGDMDFFVMEFFGLTAYNLADSTDVNVKMNVKETKLFLARSYLITLQVNSFNYVHNDGHGNNWAYSRTQPNVLFLFDFGRTRKLENGAMSFAVQDLSWWYENAKWFCAQHNRLADQEFYKEAAAALMKVWKTLNQMCGKNIDNVVVPLDSFRANSFDAYMKHALMVELNGYVKEWLETEGTNNINSQEDLSRWSTAEAAKNKKAAGATGTRRKRTGTEEPKIKPVSMEEADKFFKDVKRPESIDPKAKEPKLVRKPILVE